MDKQKQNAARPQGFRSNRRPEQAAAEEEKKIKKPAAKKRAPKPAKKRVKRRRPARKRLNAKQCVVLIAVLLAFVITAVLVVRVVIAYNNRTVHMLPEIRDIEETEEGEFVAESPLSDLQIAEATAADQFVAEGAGT